MNTFEPGVGTSVGQTAALTRAESAELPLSDQLTLTQIKKANIEIANLLLPWYKSPAYLAIVGSMLATGLAAFGFWKFNADRLRLGSDLQRLTLSQGALQAISDSEGTVLVSGSHGGVSYMVAFDEQITELFTDIDRAIWQVQEPLYTREPRTHIDHALAQLANLSPITALEINTDHWSISSPGYYSIMRLPALGTLSLTGRSVDDHALKVISQCDNLKTLAVASTRITDAGLRHVANMRHLEALVVSSPQITDSGVSSLSRLTNIHTLAVSGTGLTPLCVPHIARLQQLEQLFIGFPITDDSLAFLVALQNLRAVDIYRGGSVSGDGLRHIAAWKRLEELHIGEARAITDATLANLLPSDNLKSLSLRKAPLTDSGLQYLSTMRSLQFLYLDSNAITDKGIVALADLPHIERLQLDNALITGVGLVHFHDAQHLRVLKLHDSAVTDAAIDPLIAIRSLQEVHLGGTTITRDGIRRLELARPDINVADY